MSRPTRGAWIETRCLGRLRKVPWSRPTRGAWIETTIKRSAPPRKRRRAPRGARGLKRLQSRLRRFLAPSRPTRGAWIETLTTFHGLNARRLSRPTRGAWIETYAIGTFFARLRSRPTRGAWIETPSSANARLPKWSRPTRGAWIETPVDHNAQTERRTSRPTRGAWIETGMGGRTVMNTVCRAPRGARGLKPSTGESFTCLKGRAPRGARGLKHLHKLRLQLRGTSRPTRGAWIETLQTLRGAAQLFVAPH